MYIVGPILPTQYPLQSRSTVRVIMDLLEVANKRAVPGILIFNQSKEPIFINPVALGILSSTKAEDGGNSPSGASGNGFGVSIPREISNLYDSLKKNFLSLTGHPGKQVVPQISIFSSLESTYCCRGFSLEGDEKKSLDTFHIMMLIEKISKQRQIDLEKIKQRFHLTPRQLEIVKHVFSGATNKQIADLLCVSEDTIKGHLKHVMRRLKVNSRTEILSLILQL